jgi:hypothetical protein
MFFVGIKFLVGSEARRQRALATEEKVRWCCARGRCGGRWVGRRHGSVQKESLF